MINLTKANIFYNKIEVIQGNKIVAFYDYFFREEDYSYNDLFLQVDIIGILWCIYSRIDNNIQVRIYFNNSVNYKTFPANTALNIIINNIKAEDTIYCEKYYLKHISLYNDADGFKKWLKYRIDLHNKIDKLRYILFQPGDLQWKLSFYNYKDISEVESEYNSVIQEFKEKSKNCNIKKAA